MNKRDLKTAAFFLMISPAALAIDLPPPPPVPASLAAPDLSEAQRAAVEQAFREIREKAAEAAEAQPPAPPPPPIPADLPGAPRFDAETQARVDASFSPLAVRATNMGSLSPVLAAAPARAPASEARPVVATVEEQADQARQLSFLDFWPEDKKRLVAEQLYLGLERDEVPADSVLGKVLKAQRERAEEESSIFRQVRSAYRAREHLFQPVRLASGAP